MSSIVFEDRERMRHPRRPERRLIANIFDRLGIALGMEPHFGQLAVTRLSDQDIEDEEYKKIVGSSSTTWEGAGHFQLHLLRMGLERSSRLLDIGCGPGRGSEHFIDFLDASNYLGMDRNPSFIRACQSMVVKKGFASKEPRFEVAKNFQFETRDRKFDFAIAFSVLQYCPPELRREFFRQIQSQLHVGGKLYVSHAHWFSKSQYAEGGLTLTRRIDQEAFDLSEFGWTSRANGARVFPILELTRTVGGADHGCREGFSSGTE